jgi:predicted outer membrane repeat protein
MYKKSLFVICFVICLFSVAAVSAGGVDDNVTASDEIDIQEELSIKADETPDEDLASTDDVIGNDLPLKSNVKTYKDLNNTINGNNDSVIYLQDDYTFNIHIDTNQENQYIDDDYEILRYGIEINRPLTIYGNGHTLSANRSSSTVFKVYSDSVTLYDINFIGGLGIGNGGLLYAKNNLTVINCNFSDSSSNNAGSIYVEGTATISNCIFLNNYAWLHDFGALYASSGNISNCRFVGNYANSYGAVYLGTGSVVNCYFEENRAKTGPSGALYIGRAGKVSNCTFKGNYANNGGAICADGNIVISDSTFIGNYAYEDGGALILIEATVVNCSFVGNYAEYNIGAMSMESGSIINCSFVNNKAVETGSGAVYIETKANIENCNFTDNRAESRGGAISIGSFRNPSGSWSTNIINCIFTNNKATLYGGAIFGGNVKNCIFKGNNAKWGFTTYATKCSPYVNKIVATAISTVYNVDKYLVITLYDNKGNAVKNYKLDIEFNGKVKTYTTNSLGQVKISTANLSPKKYDVFISASENNDKYLLLEKNTRITINKAVPKLTATAKTFYLNDKVKKYVVVMKTNKNKVLKNAKVTINVGGKTYAVKTNAKGQAIFSLNKLAKKGSFKAIIKFAGNGYYNAINKNVYIKVK